MILISMKQALLQNLLLMAILIVLVPSSFAMSAANTAQTGAVEEPTIDFGTKEESRLMHSSKGAQIRILQLEAAVVKNIVKGRAILSYLKEQGKDVAELEIILLELEEVKGEVAELDYNSLDAVKQFVDLKHDATELSKEFRDAVRGMISESEVTDLENSLQNNEVPGKEELRELNGEIHELKVQYNTDKLRKAAVLLRIRNPDLIEKIENNEITPNEFKLQLKERLNAISVADKQATYAKLKEDNIQNTISMKSKIENLKKSLLERKENRLNTRVAKLQKLDAIKANAIKANVQRRLVNAEYVANAKMTTQITASSKPSAGVAAK